MNARMSEDLTQRIEEAAAGPARVRHDGTEVEAQPLKDLVEADNHLAAKRAADKPQRGLRFTRLVSR